MATAKSLKQIETGELIQAVDDARDPSDPFKLNVGLRTTVDTRLADGKAKDQATLLSEGDRATASANVRTALDQLKNLLRDGYNFIQGIGSFAISDAERLGLYTAYGWTSGKVGKLNDARIEQLANQSITTTPTITNPDHQYPAALMTLITEELATVNANQPLATGGDRQTAIAARDEALELLQTVNDRVRFYYCSASDDEDFTPELAKIGKQPRRKAGTVGGGDESGEEEPLPGVPGPVAFDETTLTLSVTEMPANATTIRAYRQAEGGQAELAGESATIDVSVVNTGALTPDVTYEFWLVGSNLAGDGPESERIQFTAPAMA